MTTQQTVISEKKPQLLCRYCNTVAIEFDVNRRSRTGKLLPIEVASGVAHSCTMSPYNQQKNGTAAVKTPAEISSTISQIEMIEINAKLTKIESQLTKLLEQYNVKMDGLTGE